MNDIELIEKFLSGDLTDAEQTEFEARLKDRSFAEKLNTCKLAILATQRSQEQHIIEFLETKKAASERSKRKNNVIRFIIGIAALFLGAWFFIIYPNNIKENPYEILFASNFKDYPFPGKKRGDDTSIVKIINYELAFQAYDDENYDLFLKLLPAIKEQRGLIDTVDYTAILFCEISALLRIKQTTEARNIIQEVIASGEEDEKQTAEGFEAFSYVKDEAKADCINSFDKILSNPDHEFHAKAQLMKSKVETFE